MERLTQWIGDDEERRAIPRPDIRSNGHGRCCNKLAEYEDAEEQGLLVRLPANKNGEIYLISSRWTVCSECGSRFDEYNCIGCEYECDSEKEYYVCPTYLSTINVSAYANRFGRTVFLTREEAEKKLEELRNEKI